jgi:cyanate permease
MALVPLATGWLADATGSFVAPLAVAGVASALGILCYLLLITENVIHKRR